MSTPYWKDVWRIIKGADTSTCRDTKGHVVVNSGLRFKGMPLSKQTRVIDAINDAQKSMMMDMANISSFTSPAQVRDSVAKNLEPLARYNVRGAGSGTELVSRVMDSILGSGYNLNTTPSFGGLTTPNLWIDPGEAASIYSSGGLPALTINKKSKSIAHNGVRIINSELKPEQMEKVNESAMRTGLARAFADSDRDGLVYGGSLLFPIFKKDSPITMLMSIQRLAELGIVGKGCIDRYVVLDRNNAILIPNWNPTAADFLNPRLYFIPYLGSDVNGQRCARIVPIPQAGYWGVLMSMGWGASDIQGWYNAACNYEGVSNAVPRMLEQMSILVRTFNVDLANGLNGATSLKETDLEDTLAVREASNDNPISMDVIGDLKAIDRDFTAVAELSRIVRQDFAMRANLPEEQLWSSDRGAFSSGDQTDGVNERQWEGMKYIHNEIESRGKNIAMLEIINALGKDRDIIRALPYTRIEFLPPKIENAEKRAALVKDLSESIFNFVASGMQLDSALSIVLPFGDEHLAPTAAILDKIDEHQKEVDAQSKEDHELDVQLKQKQIDAPVAVPGQSVGAPKAAASGEKKKYSPLEQKMHEKTRGGSARREGLQKAEGKKL